MSDALEDVSINSESLKTGKVIGIMSVTDEVANGKMATVVELSLDIAAKTFIHVLQFLYTGVPKFADDMLEEEIENVANAARIFKLLPLETICKNRRNDEEFLNPSIGTFLNDETGKMMKQMFFNQDKLSDVLFMVEGECFTF